MADHSTGPLSVLFVEDEPDIRLIVSMALAADPDVRLDAFKSGVEALAAFGTGERPYDVALLNLKLPTMSGVELMHRLRAKPGCEKLPVVFITSSVRPQEVQAYVDEGANGAIEKPFDPLTLAKELRKKMAGPIRRVKPADSSE